MARAIWYVQYLRVSKDTMIAGQTYVRSQYHTSIKNGNMPRNRLANFIRNLAVSGTRTVQINSLLSFQFQASSVRGGLIASAN